MLNRGQQPMRRPMNKMAAMAAILAGMGTNGDSMMGHLTPGEVVVPRSVIDNEPSVMGSLIKAFNKAGLDWRKFMVDSPRGGDDKRNPNTGMPAYWSEGEASGSMGGFGDSPDAGQSDFGGGGQDTMTGGSYIDAISQGNPPAADLSIAPSSPTNPDTGNFTFEGVPEGASLDMGVDPGQSMSPMDAAKLGLPTQTPKNATEALTAALIGAASGGLTGAGIRAGAAWAGPAITAAFEGLLGRAATHNKGVSYDYAMPDTITDHPQYSPAIRETMSNIIRGYNRPDEMKAPPFLGVSGMTSPQARSYVATQGTMGNDARFRDPEVWQYYANLLMRDLISDTGSLAPYSTVLPVEHQYLGQRGLSYDPTVGSLLDAIAAA